MISYTIASFSLSLLSIKQTQGLFVHNKHLSIADNRRKKQMLSLIGKIALQKAVQKLLQDHSNINISTEDIRIDNDIYGKPFIKNYPIEVSMSHTNEEALAVATFSRHTKGIGIDRERVRIFDTKMTSAFLNEEEDRWCKEDNTDTNRRKTLCWSYKESFLKAIGTGLRIHPKNVTILPHSEKNVSLQYGRYQATGREISSHKENTITTLVTIV